VPEGAYLPAGFAIRRENSETALPFVWQACVQGLCEAVTEVAPALLTDLSADGQAVLGAFRPTTTSETFVFRFGMQGVNEGLAALAASRKE
jgi:hypothetical protein